MVKGHRGFMLVLSAPSGAGKTSLTKRLLSLCPGMRYSVSFTTRRRRAHELDGVDYHFVTEADFRRRVEAGDFVEWAEVHGNLYGTARKLLEEVLETGGECILDIDVQGAAQIRKTFGRDSVGVFVLPPSWSVLAERLRRRGSDADEVIQRRLEEARREVERSGEYDYVIVNEDLEQATRILHAILIAERAAAHRLTGVVSLILRETPPDSPPDARS